MFKDGRITYLKDEFEGEMTLEVKESQAVVEVVQGGIKMEVQILGDAVNGN